MGVLMLVILIIINVFISINIVILIYDLNKRINARLFYFILVVKRV